MTWPLADFPTLQAVLQEGSHRQLHTGVQLYVSLRGNPVLDCGFGTADRDRRLDEHARMLWRSAGKPLTAVLIMQQMERGHLSLQSTLGELLPVSLTTDKSLVTIEQLLTHTAGFPTVETGWPAASWSQSVHAILQSPRQLPLGTAAYHPLSSWFLLGEILCRLKPEYAGFADLLQAELLSPLQMSQTSCGSGSERTQQDDRPVPVLYDRDRGQLVESVFNAPEFRSRPSPGGSLRGPVRELGLFYEMLCRDGRLTDGTAFLQPETVAQMTQRWRTGQFDQTFQHVIDFGLGVIVDSSQHGPDTVPYGFGRCCSPSTFGHGGSQCSMGFCDPEQGLVVVWAANGFCGEGQHQRRNRAINEAIYRDLLGITPQD